MPTVSQDEFELDKLEIPSYFPYYAFSEPGNIPLFAGLGPILSLSRGYVLKAKGNVSHCYLVTQGMLTGTFHGADGFDFQSALFLPGSLMLEPSTLAKLPANAGFKAVEPSKLMRIAYDDLKLAMAERPGVFDAVMQSIAMKLNSAHEQLREFSTLDVRGRIYFMLLGIAATCGQRADGQWIRVTVKLTQQQMSAMLGINRVTVNTALQDLYDKGIVMKESGYYHVLDEKGMLSHL